ncbi:hypothetical protein BADSM9389_07930 [Buttiauxella agrestis]|nr:hypothetical protein BADSM9389_07930 [Buttiauxella agrestis]
MLTFSFSVAYVVLVNPASLARQVPVLLPLPRLAFRKTQIGFTPRLNLSFPEFFTRKAENIGLSA